MSWRWGRPSPAFPREGIVVATAVGAVGLGGVAETIAVAALGVAVGVDGFLNLEPLREEEEGREEFLYVVGVDGDNH